MIPLLLHAHTRPLTRVIYNRQGDLLFSASKDSVAFVWYSHNGERLGSFDGHEGVVWCLAVTDDSRMLVSGSGDATARIWSVETGRQLAKLELETAVRAVSWSQGDSMLAVVTDAIMGKSAKIMIYALSAEQGTIKLDLLKEIDCTTSSKTKPTVIAWSDCNEFLVTGHQDGSMAHWDWKVGDKTSNIEVSRIKASETVHKDAIRDLQMSSDRSYCITASNDMSAKIVDIASLTALKTFKAERPVNTAAISPIRNEVVIGGGQEAISVTTTSSRSGHFESRFFHQIYEKEIGRVKGHFGPINTIAYHPSGKGFSSGGEDGYIRLHKFDSDYFDFMKDEPVFL